MKFWTMVNGFPGKTGKRAAIAEEHGWDGILVPDSQNLTGDPYMNLGVAAHVTDKLLLKTGVTNSHTRHPAVTATSIASVQVESGGRATLGIGRGDSALAYIGLAPMAVDPFFAYVSKVQAYLRKENVPFDVADAVAAGAREVAEMKLGGRPSESQLRWWLHADVPKPPVEIAASGPRVIRGAALIADRINFGAGSDPARIQWGIDLAHEARAESGLDLPPIEFGATIAVTVDDDADAARRSAAATTLAPIIRFSVMHGKPVGPVSPEVREALLRVHSQYDMNRHGRPGRQTAGIDDVLVEAFAIAGTPEYCIDRICRLAEIGLTHMDVVSHWKVDEETGEVTQPQLTETVLAGVRARLGETASAAALVKEGV
jgi:5,10-methylenetetrahydromethanopterin reductase